jgi:hypothetical protein
MRRSTTLTLCAGIALISAAVALVLSESPSLVLATNGAIEDTVARSANGELAACQANEEIPRGTTAIRLSLSAFIGPRVKVRMLALGRVVASGERDSAWSGHVVTVPLRNASRATTITTLCFATLPLHDELIVYGSPTRQAIAAHTSDGRSLAGRVKVEYLGTGRASWLSLATSIARHMGLGRAWSGTWIAFLVATLTLAATALACVLLVRESDE